MARPVKDRKSNEVSFEETSRALLQGLSDDALARSLSERLAIKERERRATRERYVQVIRELEAVSFELNDPLVPARKLRAPPGHTLVRVLSFIYPTKTYERVYQQHILDMRQDHNEALLHGEIWKARWIEIRDNLIVIPMIIAHLPTVVMKYVAKIWTLGH